MLAGPYEGVAQRLAGTAFASIAYVEATESTNADAAALLGDDRFAGHTIVAEYQRSGAGRKGRSWQAAAGSALLFSTILPRSVASEGLWLVPFWTALAVGAGLRECGVATTLQWPNDLLLRERKVAGVLCQSSVTGATARVACGVGINVYRWREAERTIAPPPAFCDDATEVTRGALLQAILAEYARTLTLLDRPERVVADWTVAAQVPGRRYRIALDGGEPPFEATAQGLTSSGGLEVLRDGGRRETIALADARVLREGS
jgi:BirA family transcriptional regulator, biotin operon repressor / biotin---[acetyl-CoA-carboxylase] ligase